MPKPPAESKLKVIRVEPTPNPNARKFVLSRSISESTVSARTAAEAAGHPLCAALFTINGVTGVMILNDFVTINASPGTKWADMKNAVQQNLHLEKPMV